MRDLSTVPWKRTTRAFQTPLGIVKYTACFLVPSPDDQMPMLVLVSDGHGWDHVSVSRKDRKVPSWAEMEFVKRGIFRLNEVAMQLHVPPKDHINVEGVEVLHLWRPQHKGIPRPPKELV